MKLAPIFRVFAIVTGAALVGMVMGGVFGHCAAIRSPEFVLRALGCREITGSLGPVQMGEVAGMTYGLLLGGGLGTFAVAVAVFHRWIDTRSKA